MQIDRDKLFRRIQRDAADGFDGNEGAGASAPWSDKQQSVFTAARQADHRYDGGHADSQGITRAEYVGRAVLAVLYGDT